ncbi:MAG: ABC transporter ATP-binding protein [Chlamydiae bacterium]|nr:ABC transporter ATP-binding protein [Chlamydiota bacterium]
MMLKVQDLHVFFSIYGRKLHAVRGVSFEIQDGEAIGIVGESGCGKSATAQAILRLSNAAEIQGSVYLDGEELLEKTEVEMQKIRGKKVGMVFQDPMSSLNPTMTIGHQIMEGLLHHGICSKKEARQRTIELLKKTDVPYPEERFKQYPHQLSGGMRQRVLIAIALSAKPKLIIADEPTTALDMTIQAQILELFKRRGEKTSLLLISHDLSVIAKSCQRVLVFYAGKIVESGPVQDILKTPRHPYTQMLLRSLPNLNRSRSEPLVPIPGSPPNLFYPISGCPFLERCPHRTDRCNKEPPFINSSACWIQAPS